MQMLWVENPAVVADKNGFLKSGWVVASIGDVLNTIVGLSKKINSSDWREAVAWIATYGDCRFS